MKMSAQGLGDFNEDEGASTTNTAMVLPGSAQSGHFESLGAGDASRTTAAAAGPAKKRRRPALACEQCRRRKVKCDQKSPCGHCLKGRIPNCTYVPTHIPASRVGKKQTQTQQQQQQQQQQLASQASRDRPVQPAPAPPPREQQEEEMARPTFTPPCSLGSQSELLNPSSLPASIRGPIPAVPNPTVPSSLTGSVSEASDVRSLVARVHFLEEKLEKVALASGAADKSTARLEKNEGEHDAGAAPRGIISKTRYFGRSHWMNGFILLPLELDTLVSHEMVRGELYQILTKCKTLGRRVKESRLKPLTTTDLGNNIPSRDLADALVEAYLRTFEGCLRILHVPTFRADYERYWQNPAAASDWFKIQLQLCLALGAVFYDETFTLRSSAMQWIYEAQLWLMLPPEKGRMTIAGIQIMCLLTLARGVCAVGHDLVWITTGSLVRKAMYMGLHRDPKHLCDMTTYRAEMRRRLWSTILELNLQSSFDAGGPALLSTADYDVMPPANLDDDQLGDGQDKDRKPAPGEETAVTQMSVALALLKSLPVRTNLLRHANDFKSPDSYDDTLRFNSELTKAARALTNTLAVLLKNQEREAQPKVRQFQVDMAEMLVYRCFHTLHQPVIVRSLEDPKYYFSQKMYLDGGLKIASICGINGTQARHGTEDASTLSTPSPAVSEFHQLTINGSGMFRNIPVQSLYGIILELICCRGLSASVGLGYLPAVGDYSDLRGVLEAAHAWTWRRMLSGETNVKGYCFIECCKRHADGLEAGLSKSELEAEILDGATRSAKESLKLMTAMAEREGLSTATAAGAGAGTAADGVDVEGQIPSMEGMAEFDDAMAMDSMDWMGDWTMDDMTGFSWLLNAGTRMPEV